MIDLKKLNLSVQYVVTPSGERVAVIMQIEGFEDLSEDLEDLAAVVERRDEPAISHQEVLDGLGL